MVPGIQKTPNGENFMKKILLAILLIIIAFVAYILYAIKNFSYDYVIEGYKPKTIDIGAGKAVINIAMKVIINNSLFFSIPIQSLYYEIYYKGNLLGKSADSSGFKILPKPKTTEVRQSVDIYIDKKNIQVAQNYLTKTPTEYTGKVFVRVMGIPIKVTNLKFTY